MFPFIFWLGSEAPLPPVDPGFHEGGADHYRRRALMATSSLGAWSPVALALQGDYLFEAQFVDQIANAIQTVFDRSGFGNDLGINLTGPAWDATGWSNGTPCAVFSGDPLIRDSGPLVTGVQGNDVAHTSLCYLNLSATGDQSVLCWDDPDGTAVATIDCSFFSDVSQARPSYQRISNASENVSVTAANSVATGTNLVLAWRFDGTTATVFVNGVPAVTGAIDVGTLTLSRLRLGTAPGGSNSLNGKVKHFGHATRALSIGEIQKYTRWCLTTYP